MASKKIFETFTAGESLKRILDLTLNSYATDPPYGKKEGVGEISAEIVKKILLDQELLNKMIFSETMDFFII